MSFDVVVAADLDWGIGKAGALPWPKLKADMAHFRRITSTCAPGKANAVIMGRKTWTSAEMNGTPLPKRRNIVITRSASFAVPAGVVVATSLDAAVEAAKAPDVDGTYVIGGAEIIRESLQHPELRFVYLTRVEGHFDCDVAIPDLEAAGFKKGAWDGESAHEDSGIRYRIERHERGARQAR